MVFDFGIEISVGLVVFLIACAFVAGFVDSIAGGGGMITIPALLFAGIPPLQALGTNKFQSCFGSFGASLHFYKRGHIDLKGSVGFVCVVFLSSILGSVCVELFESDFLRKCIPFLLIIFAFYFLFSPKITQDSGKAILGSAGLGFVLGIIGFYDGFFGPGTGSFFMLSLITLGGFSLLQALANAKLFNFATNLASMLVFAFGGHILWIVGLCMALGQFAGASLGSRIAIGYGVKIIKPLVVCVSLAACVNLLYKEFFTSL
ncbi:TSUP family transporter [Helicobacter cinaedi]|uniref:TSUP family transporter n=1 Tax=Helicobacter cinaedi TaxID=213 RepID=UPI000DA25A1E|nr:TSUP family transporter [Helicobacter cinaedi]